LRRKVLLTVLGAVAAALGASTFLSFRYWRAETLATAERQALLAATSTRATVESALRDGRPDPARRALIGLVDNGTIRAARVYGADRVIRLSADRFEEGDPAPPIFLPPPTTLPREGIVRESRSGESVRAFVPTAVPEPALLEIELSVAAIRSAMDRGARLGFALMAISLVAVAVIVLTMFEKEVVAPLHRIDVLLHETPTPGSRAPPGDEIQNLTASVTFLLEKEQAAEARAADREGLARVGELAAEMAHEFKRPLASVRAAVDVLQQEYSLPDEGRSLIDAVDGQLERLHETMQDLFSIATPTTPVATEVDVAATLDEALAEVSGLPAFDDVAVERVYAGMRVCVPGDPRRVRQAFLNVLANGAEAMPEGGRLTIRLEPRERDVEISFTDTGVGLEPDQVERVLKPFYSTKPMGTGLGLPLVARVVSAHQGGLSIESWPGHGTTVRISLPRASRANSGLTADPAAPEQTRQRPTEVVENAP
jgi:signal transduction histidine kinase